MRRSLNSPPIGSSALANDRVQTPLGSALQLPLVSAANARVEVLQGVKPGATVLAARFDNLRDGAKAGVAAKAASSVSVASSASGAATVQK